MNDSFLEDLGLVEQKTGSTLREAERNITTRQGDSPTVGLGIEFEREIMKKQLNYTTDSPVSSKQLTGTRPQQKSAERKSPEKRLNVPKVKKPINEVKISPTEKKKNVRTETKLKTVDKGDRLGELKSLKVHKKVTAFRESSSLSDGSSKENSRRSEFSVENVPPEILKERRKSSDSANKKSEITDNTSLAMLTAIKEIISTYTKVESNKVMRMMQDLYINSQSNLIKQLMLTTDELKDLNVSEGSPRYQAIIRENAQLLENVAFLRARVAELQKSSEEIERLKQENLILRGRIKELEK